jgi:transcriptional regulator with XRE-family HTH domain
MAIRIDPQAENALAVQLGKRLKLARTAAGMTLDDARKALGQRNLGQVCQHEKGRRLPGTLQILRYSNLYDVSTDFLFGLTDIPTLRATPKDVPSAAIAGTVQKCMAESLDSLTRIMASRIGILVVSFSQDRVELRKALEIARQANESLARIRARHSQFDDQVRGGAKLVTLLGQLSIAALEFGARERRERLELGDIETAVLRPARFGFCD